MKKLHQYKAPCILTFAPCACGVLSSFNWYKHSTCTGGGCHQLQLALVVLFQSATSADRPLAHVVVSPSATCIDGAFSSRQWRKTCTCTQATCTVWWGYIYIYCMLSVSVMQAGVTCASVITTQLESVAAILQLQLSSCVVIKLVQVTPACITLTDNT